MTRVLGVVALTGVYVLALGSLEPADIGLGVVVAVALLAWLPPRARPSPVGPATLWRLVPVALSTLWQVTAGTARVSLTVLGLRSAAPGKIDVRLERATPASIALASAAITLTPGEVVVDADPDRRTMVVHLLDARDPESARASCRALHDRCLEALER